MPQISTGWAKVEFTPDPGLPLLGQMHARRGLHVRDPLMASAVAFGSSGAAVVMTSVDICMLSKTFIQHAQQAFSSATGLPPGRLLIHTTHTHVAPTATTMLGAEADSAFALRLRTAIVDAAGAALSALAPAEVYAGSGVMDQMGWNRRAMFADGSSVMYGRADSPGFVGIEGPRDPTLSVLFDRAGNGRIRGVVVNFSTHPNTLENESLYSADIPGEARRVIKQMLGPDLVVVYLTGAAGNTAPSILDPPLEQQPWRGEDGLARSGLYLAGEAARVIASCTSPVEGDEVRLETSLLKIPVREWPKPTDRSYPQPLLGEQWAAARPYYAEARSDWPRRLEEENPVEIPLHVLRVGDAAFCTNPGELFVEYGLDIRRHSPARVTFISELTDGCVGYIPTRNAMERGGYETWPAPTSQLAVGAGDEIVAETLNLLRKLF